MSDFTCLSLRPDEVTLKDSHQYEDNQAGDEDAFAREPFILRFDCPTTGLCCLLCLSSALGYKTKQVEVPNTAVLHFKTFV